MMKVFSKFCWNKDHPEKGGTIIFERKDCWWVTMYYCDLKDYTKPENRHFKNSAAAYPKTKQYLKEIIGQLVLFYRNGQMEYNFDCCVWKRLDGIPEK